MAHIDFHLSLDAHYESEHVASTRGYVKYLENTTVFLRLAVVWQPADSVR